MHRLKLVQQLTAGLGFVQTSISVSGISQDKLKNLLPLENTVIIQGMVFFVFTLITPPLLPALEAAYSQCSGLRKKKAGEENLTHTHVPPIHL